MQLPLGPRSSPNYHTTAWWQNASCPMGAIWQPSWSALAWLWTGRNSLVSAPGAGRCPTQALARRGSPTRLAANGRLVSKGGVGGRVASIGDGMRRRASTPRRMQRLNQLEVQDVAKKIEHPLSVPRSRVGLCAKFRGHAAWAQHIFYCYRKRIGRSYRGKAVRCSGSLSLLCIKGTTDGGNANTIGCSPGFSR